MISLLAAIVVAIHWQPPDADEFYTYYVTLPTFGFGEALFNHWLVDNHPPLFYGLPRATVWLGSSIEARRFVNVIMGSAIVACGMLAIRNDRKANQLAVLFFLFLAGQFDLISQAANLRSYFLSLCAASLLVLVLTAAWLDTGPLPRARRFALAVAILISLNVHIVTTLIAGTTLAIFLVGTLLKRRFELLWAILVPSLIAGMIFLAITAFQLPYWLENTTTWIGYTTTEAGRLQKATHGILFAALQAVGANVVIFILGWVGGIALLLKSWKYGTVSSNLQVISMLGMSIVCVLGVILPSKSLRIFASERFLLGLIPVAAMILAIGTWHMLDLIRDARATLIMLIAGFASVLAIGYSATREVLVPPSMSELVAERLRQAARNCPNTIIHVLALPPSYYPLSEGRDSSHARALTLRLTAADYGLHIEPLESRRLSADCPTIFWSLFDPKLDSGTALTDNLLRLGFPVTPLYRYRSGWISIASTRPLE